MTAGDGTLPPRGAVAVHESRERKEGAGLSDGSSQPGFAAFAAGLAGKAGHNSRRKRASARAEAIVATMEYQQNQQQPTQQPGNGKAIASLVLGIVAAVLVFFGTLSILSIILAVIGLVLGVQARREMPQGTAGMATAGMVLSIVVLALAVIVLVSCTACAALVAGTAGALY